MTALERNNVVEHGVQDGRPMVFAHGFGCDQNMWRFVAPVIARRFAEATFFADNRADLSADAA